jgi:hypothetical protein
MLHGIRKRLAIRGYTRGLGRELRRRHGRRSNYTPAQVKQTIEDSGFCTVFMCYALAMYCDRDAFTEHHRNAGESCDYDAMRFEIGQQIFQGDTSFDASAVIDGGTVFETSGDAASFGDGGGDCGGDGGGGGD